MPQGLLQANIELTIGKSLPPGAFDCLLQQSHLIEVPAKHKLQQEGDICRYIYFIEEGAAYSQLLNDFNCTHEELATKLGRSRPLISNTMRLLNLPPAVQRKVAAGVISAGHARALLGLTDESEIEKLANRIVAEGLSVRATEEAVAIHSPKKKGTTVKSGKAAASGETLAAAELLSDYLDTRVNVQGVSGMGR
jgi:ParB family chromosome partitioning protein